MVCAINNIGYKELARVDGINITITIDLQLFISSSMDALDKSKEIGAHQPIADLSEAVPNNRKRSHEDESKSIIDEVCVSKQKDLD
nr:9022_t:CDS:2 [Entrophospora candida]